ASGPCEGRRETLKRLTAAVSSRLAPAVLALLVLAVQARGASAQGGIQPLPPDGSLYGLKLADWAIAYTQWVMSIPKSVHPDTGFDKTGLRAGVGQRNPVWFVPRFEAGSNGTRVFTIPDGQALMVALSIVNTGTPGAQTEEALLAPATEVGDAITALEVNLDGAMVSDVKRFRAKTPGFTIVLPPGNILDQP